MNAAQLHLVLNHFPVVLVVVAAVFLVWGVLRKSAFAQRAGLLLVFLGGLSSVPAFLSGEPAEEIVESRPGVSEALIEEHEEAAEAGLFAALASGLMAAGAGLLLRKGNPRAKHAVLACLAATLVSAALLGRAAHLGGLIRHDEIRAGGGAAAQPSVGDD